MRGYPDRKEKITGRTVLATGAPLTFEPDLLTIPHPNRDAHIEFAPVGQGDATRAATCRFLEADGHRERVVLAAPGSTPAPTATAAENLAEDLFGPEATFGCFRIAPGKMEITRSGSWPKAASAGIEPARIAVGVDHALIEFLPLLLVAQNIVGSAYFLKPLLCRRIAALGVGMMFLRQRAESLLDVGFARALRNTQNVIGVTHALPIE